MSLAIEKSLSKSNVLQFPSTRSRCSTVDSQEVWSVEGLFAMTYRDEYLFEYDLRAGDVLIVQRQSELASISGPTLCVLRQHTDGINRVRFVNPVDAETFYSSHRLWRLSEFDLFGVVIGVMRPLVRREICR